MASETNQFAAQFNTTVDLARWNEAVGGRVNAHYAWFRAERPGEDAPPGQYDTEFVRLKEARNLEEEADTLYVPSPGSRKPAWMSNSAKSGIRLTYDHAKAPADGNPSLEEVTIDRHGWERYSDGLWRALYSAYRPATVGRACVRWSGLADTHADLASTVRVYADWMTPGRPEGAMGDNERMGTSSMQRSLGIARDFGLPYAAAEPYVDALRALDLDGNPNHRAVHEVAELALRAALLDERELRGVIASTYQPIPRPISVEAVRILEEQELLSPNWWMGTAIAGGGAIRAPELLPIVYEKLAGEYGAEIAETLPPISAQALIKSYIAELLNTYAGDEGRDRIAATKIQKAVIDGRGTADLMQLIAIANGIMRSEDRDLDPSLRRPFLNPRRMHSVGDALLIVLEKTRSVTATDEQWGAQFDQDVLHAEILDTLHARLEYGRTEALQEQITLNSMLLRYPLASPETLSTIRGELTAGAPPAQVRSRFKGRATRSISAWRAKAPGRGLLS